MIHSRNLWTILLAASLVLASSPARVDEGVQIRLTDQGGNWNEGWRALYYTQDQGSQMIPKTWLEAITQEDGKPFLDGSLARYGYLPLTNAVAPGLPVGFTTSASAQGAIVGMTCAACHVRQITVGRVSYRIDGGPAFGDLGSFLTDLDAAVHRVLSDDAVFETFARQVSRTGADDPVHLRANVKVWWTRFHAWIGPSIPRGRRWGPTRLDAMGLIYNRLAGIDVSASSSDVLSQNIAVADAPTRYPFLWDASRQDYAQWTGFSQNGNDFVALARNLGQLYGVFGVFHPRPESKTTPIKTAPAGLDREYLVGNSANFAGLSALENAIKQLGPPVWPWKVDRSLASRGKAIYERSTSEGGCVACHGITPGEARPPSAGLWKTPIQDVGTDTRAWKTLLRTVDTADMSGSTIPGGPALQHVDYALSLLKASVVGSVIELRAELEAKAAKGKTVAPQSMPMVEAPALSRDRVSGVMNVRMEEKAPSKPVTDVYEARVLRGVWAAAPYLHNGSVPTLADLLEPSSSRPKTFKIGPAYDIDRIGLASDQSATAFTLSTTGCEDRSSGDSNCGHEYGTKLPVDEKRALIEYLKTL